MIDATFKINYKVMNLIKSFYLTVTDVCIVGLNIHCSCNFSESVKALIFILVHGMLYRYMNKSISQPSPLSAEKYVRS